MKFALLVLISSVLAGTSDGYCNICGPDMMIGDRDGLIIIPGRQNRTCGELQDLGDEGLINEDQCSELVPLMQEPCDCTSFVCNICGVDGRLTDPEGSIDIPGDESITTCDDLDNAANRGDFNETYCLTLQDIAQEPCGCDTVPSPTMGPTDGPTISPEPTSERTPFPTRSPTTPDFSAGQTAIISVALATALAHSLFNVFW